MKLTLASRYALHALVPLAKGRQHQPVACHVVATAEGIPDQFLLKILNRLVRVGILLSAKGPHGGFQLARAPETISVLEVIEAVDGPLRGREQHGVAADADHLIADRPALVDRRRPEATRPVADEVDVHELARPDRGPAHQEGVGATAAPCGHGPGTLGDQQRAVVEQPAELLGTAIGRKTPRKWLQSRTIAACKHNRPVSTRFHSHLAAVEVLKSRTVRGLRGA